MLTYTTTNISQEFKQISKIYNYRNISHLLQACKNFKSPDFIIITQKEATDEILSYIDSLPGTPSVFIQKQ